MDFKKCVRCGCFFLANADICPKCLPKDQCEIAKIKNYIYDNEITSCSTSNLSINTGVSLKNINRYLNNKDIPKINI